MNAADRRSGADSDDSPLRDLDDYRPTGGRDRSGVFRVGEHATFVGRRPDDPYILAFQYYVRVAEELGDGRYVIEVSDTMPPNARFGPFPADRLAHGWKDHAGRWRQP